MTFISAATAFKILYLKGTPYQMGVQHGQLMRDEIRYAIDNCVGIWGIKLHKWNKKDICNYATQAFKVAEQHIQDEYHGIAYGSGIPLEEILIWNYIDDYWELFQCSAFAAFNRITQDGKMLVARNNDYENDESAAISVTIVRVPDIGIPSLCNTWAGTIGAYEGINLKGLVTATQFSDTYDKNLCGKSIKQINLDVLNYCVNAQQAREHIGRSLRNFGCNILLADSDNCLVLECSGNNIIARYATDDYIVATNHFCELNLVHKISLFSTQQRKQFLENQLMLQIGQLNIDNIKYLMAQSPVGRIGGRDYFTTRCAIYEPQQTIIHVAHGLLPAFKGPHIKLNLCELIKKDVGIEHIYFEKLSII